MNSNDKTRFTQLMIMMAEVAAGNEKMKQPSENKIAMYFDFLKDLDFDTIKDNANNHYRKNKWFPAICELRNETDENLEAEALKAFDEIKELMQNFYIPELGAAGRQAIIIKLESDGKSNLIPLLDKWGSEIVTGNTQVVRAQFIKSYKAIEGQDKKLLRTKEPKQIGSLLKEQITKGV